MDIMTHAKLHFNRLMLSLSFGIWTSKFSPPPPPPFGSGERLKRPGIIGLKFSFNYDLKLSFLRLKVFPSELPVRT